MTRSFRFYSALAVGLAIGMPEAMASSLAVNFVNNATDAAAGGSQDQAGFEEIVVANAAGPGGIEVNAGTVGGVSIILQNVDVAATGNNRIRSVDRGDARRYTGTFSNLSVGWIGNEDGAATAGGADQFLVKLRSVTAGPHLWTSYHIDNGTDGVNGTSGGNQSGQMLIELSVDGGANYSTVASNYQILDAEVSFDEIAGQVPSDSPVNFTFTTAFVANGTDDVVFRFTNNAIGFNTTILDASQDFTLLNGFEVAEIPEPSTLALLGLCGLGLAMVRRSK